MTTQETVSKRMVSFLLLASTALVVAGGAAFYFAAKMQSKPNDEPAIVVTVNRSTCEPMNITVEAGKSIFEIHNASDRPIEWEILDGVMVVEERENIAPGFHSRLSAKLRPGTYAITCGLLTNPRGGLTVTESSKPSGNDQPVPTKAFIGPLSELKVYLALQSGKLTGALEELDRLITNGDLEGAKAAWHEARLPYRRIEAFADNFSDLENAIDTLPDYLEKREADERFQGFHRIEYGLWHQNATEDLSQYSAKLKDDALALRSRIKETRFSADQILINSERLANALSQTAKGQSDNRWANPTPAEFSASLESISKLVGLFQPIAIDKAPIEWKAYQESLAAVTEQQSKANATAEQQAAGLEQLAKAISALQTGLGLE